MSKIEKKRMDWRDLHPRAERLLTDANAVSGIINQPEDVQVAHIEGMYQRADTVRARSNTDGPSPLTLQHHAISLLTGVASRLANHLVNDVDISAEATKIMRVVDAFKMPTARNFDAMVKEQLTPNSSRVYMTREQRDAHAKAHAIELQARREQARDKREGRTRLPISYYVRRIRNGGGK